MFFLPICLPAPVVFGAFFLEGDSKSKRWLRKCLYSDPCQGIKIRAKSFSQKKRKKGVKDETVGLR